VNYCCFYSKKGLLINKPWFLYMQCILFSQIYSIATWYDVFCEHGVMQIGGWYVNFCSHKYRSVFVDLFYLMRDISLLIIRKSISEKFKVQTERRSYIHSAQRWNKMPVFKHNYFISSSPKCPYALVTHM
jgi:hypothetical protein